MNYLEITSLVIQSVAAAVMAWFSVRLYRVSSQQRELLAVQVDAAHDVERGRLYCTDVNIMGGERFCVQIMNCGRQPVWVQGIRVGVNNRHMILSEPYSSLQRGGSTRSTTVILPGSSTVLHHTWSGFMQGRNLPSDEDPLYVEVLVVYQALGKLYEYHFAWVCHEEDDLYRLIGGRYVLADYERDERTSRTASELLR